MLLWKPLEGLTWGKGNTVYIDFFPLKSLLLNKLFLFSSQVFAYDYCFWSMEETRSDKFAGLLNRLHPKHKYTHAHTR